MPTEDPRETAAWEALKPIPADETERMQWEAEDLAAAAYERGRAEGIAEGRRQALATVRRQADLPSLMHFDRPSDFRKGVLSCLAALEAAAPADQPGSTDGQH